MECPLVDNSEANMQQKSHQNTCQTQAGKPATHASRPTERESKTGSLYGELTKSRIREKLTAN